MENKNLVKVTITNLSKGFNNTKRYNALVNTHNRFGEHIIEIGLPISYKNQFENLENICITIESLGIKNLKCNIHSSAIMGTPVTAPFYSIYRFNVTLKSLNSTADNYKISYVPIADIKLIFWMSIILLVIGKTLGVL